MRLKTAFFIMFVIISFLGVISDMKAEIDPLKAKADLRKDFVLSEGDAMSVDDVYDYDGKFCDDVHEILSELKSVVSASKTLKSNLQKAGNIYEEEIAGIKKAKDGAYEVLKELYDKKETWCNQSNYSVDTGEGSNYSTGNGEGSNYHVD
jgi:hypothetical protein